MELTHLKKIELINTNHHNKKNIIANTSEGIGGTMFSEFVIQYCTFFLTFSHTKHRISSNYVTEQYSSENYMYSTNCTSAASKMPHLLREVELTFVNG